VGYTQLGIIGAVVATIVTGGVRCPLIAVHAARSCALPVKAYFQQGYLRPLIVLAALTAIGLALRQLLPVEGLGMLATATVTLGVAWAALCWWVGFVDQDRRAFLELVDGVLCRMFPARGLRAVVAPPLDSVAKED
jgi:O-antigen/teichoic acid export membrane protein